MAERKSFPNDRMSLGAAALAEAQRIYGKGEATQAIRDYLSGTGITDPVKQAWCAAFVRTVAAKVGYDASGDDFDGIPNVATEMNNIGEPVVGKPEPGDVAVLNKGFDVGERGGHVGFFKSFPSDGRISLLGGNQGNEVNVTSFPNKDVTFRRLYNPDYQTPYSGFGDYMNTPSEIAAINGATRTADPWGTPDIGSLAPVMPVETQPLAPLTPQTPTDFSPSFKTIPSISIGSIDAGLPQLTAPGDYTLNAPPSGLTPAVPATGTVTSAPTTEPSWGPEPVSTVPSTAAPFSPESIAPAAFSMSAIPKMAAVVAAIDADKKNQELANTYAPPNPRDDLYSVAPVAAAVAPVSPTVSAEVPAAPEAAPAAPQPAAKPRLRALPPPTMVTTPKVASVPEKPVNPADALKSQFGSPQGFMATSDPKTFAAGLAAVGALTNAPGLATAASMTEDGRLGGAASNYVSNAFARATGQQETTGLLSGFLRDAGLAGFADSASSVAEHPLAALGSLFGGSNDSRITGSARDTSWQALGLQPVANVDNSGFSGGLDRSQPQQSWLGSLASYMGFGGGSGGYAGAVGAGTGGLW